MTPPIARRPPFALFRLVTNRWTKPFWDAAAAHRLVAPQCAACGVFRMPPTPFCPDCRSQAVNWIELSGDGVIFSYTVVSRALLPQTEDAVPFIAAVVTLDGAGGTRLISNIVDVSIDGVRVGDMVKVVWDDYDGVTLPRFKLAATP